MEVKMTTNEEELNIIGEYELQMCSLDDKDSINKLYRQARIWNRFHHFFANACTYERYVAINATFKEIRWARLEELGFRNGGKHERNN